jgi:hypothetical protein
LRENILQNNMGNSESGLSEEFGEPFKIIVKPKGYTRKDTNRLNPYGLPPHAHNNYVREDSSNTSPARSDSSSDSQIKKN